MADALADPDHSCLVLVTTPEELPTSETKEAIAQLEEEQLIDIAAVLANRVLPPLDVTAADIAALPDGPGREAAEHHQALWAAQESSLADLATDIHLPYLFGVQTPTEVAARLADELQDSL